MKRTAALLLPLLPLLAALSACESTEVQTLPGEEANSASNNASNNARPNNAAVNSDATNNSTNNAAPEDTGPDVPVEDVVVDAPEEDAPADVVEDAVEDVAVDAPEEDVPPVCAEGDLCNPIQVTSFPFEDQRDTRSAPRSGWDSYACSPGTDEGGGEFIYEVHVEADGLLTVSVDDVGGDGVDIDVHILDDADPATCLARDNVSATAMVRAGVVYVVADTWVNGSGAALAGPYALTMGFTAVAGGRCAMEQVDLKMVWASCDPSLDCYEAEDPNTGQLARWLRTPAMGPAVREAHLVTVEEDFPDTWPTSFTDMIARHYQLSQDATGYTMNRTEPWAPAGEGGSMYGQGSTGRKVPVVDEAWYINMYWRNRPTAGTRMIVTNPVNGRAVVASAGYETGPGSNTAVAGVTEEIHHHLGSSHRSALIVGFAEDQSLPLGPIVCEP